MARTATGIDIGLRTSKVIRGQYKGKTFHVSDFAVAGGGGSDGVAEGWNELPLGFKPTGARVGLTGRDVNIRYTRVPLVPDWQLRNLMRFEVEEVGDQSGSEVSSDFNLLPTIPEIEGEDVVLLAMAREQLLEDHMEGLASVGGTLDCFTPCAVALYNAWLRYGVIEDDTVLIANIGHDNVDVVITRGPDLLFARNLTGGSRLFDEAIAQRFNVGAEQAERVKIEMASLMPGAQYATPNHERASRAILGAAGQLLSLLQSTVMFCKSQVKVTGLKVDRVVLCGGGSALDGLPQYLSAGMGVPVELFDAFRVVDTSALDAESAELLETYKLEAVIALGLATMGSDSEAYSLEILPAAVAKKRAFWGGTVWMIAAAALAVAYLGLSAYDQSRKLDSIAQENRSLRGRANNAKRVDSETRTLIAENEAMKTVADELQGLAGTGEQMATMMEFLGRNLPRDFWVEELSSGWSYDEELGIKRNYERPILLVRGRAEEGSESPTRLHQEMIVALDDALPGAAVNQAFDRDVFMIDLSLYGPKRPDAPDDADAEEGGE